MGGYLDRRARVSVVVRALKAVLEAEGYQIDNCDCLIGEQCNAGIGPGCMGRGQPVRLERLAEAILDAQDGVA